ncbi:hypothetical protein Q5H93_14205 [Hymenobacter sp. ASUV-10]|uniref:Uncharacterized protein n=1 Tax=Hymenobacter aranciens TaxID=3063996 RepID=A0ABT9BFT7_9BACT|nr:hypothetical protein [Hymenobacter sp. ASUV-10]MDO7875892.1 hypothetical protein [Hymenobacter sp. ASUV-10]
MDFEKLYRPSALNSYQFIAVTGLIMSGAAHLIIKYLVARPLPTGFGWLYVCWAGLYVVGSLLNLFGKPSSGHHHHHH